MLALLNYTQVLKHINECSTTVFRLAHFTLQIQSQEDSEHMRRTEYVLIQNNLYFDSVIF